MIRRTLFCLGVIVATLISNCAAAVAQSQIQSWLDQQLPDLTQLYFHFHRNPELSYEEQETGRRFADELEKLRIRVTREFGGYGVVGLLENGTGPTLLLRADLDALPVAERTDRPYASTVTTTDADGNTVGVMHACGHDIHMTNLIGVARYLSAHQQKWSGTVVFIGQPAEERGAGARAMLEDGLFTKFPKPDYAIALHVGPSVPAGKIAMRAGYTMANVDSVDVTLHGRGGHGAYPHMAIDPVVQAARFILDVQTIVSREVKPIEPAVITVGSIHAGTKHNIISDSCHMQLTVRSYSDEVRTLLLDGIRRKAEATAASAGAEAPEVKVSEGTPSLSNDAKLVQRLWPIFGQAIGDGNVVEAEQVMGGEDFSRYSREGGMPSLMFMLGAVEQRRMDRYEKLGISNPSLHSAEFWPDYEPALKTGITAMAAAALELLPPTVGK